MQEAVIDREEALKSVKRINESVIAVNDGCKKIQEVLADATNQTNLKSVRVIQVSFEEVSRNMAQLQENMSNVVIATEKYAAEVDEIDEVDDRIFDK